MTRIDEIAPGLYRISTMLPGEAISFNQFLIDDDRPALIHTGMHQLYDTVQRAIAQILDPKRLAYVVVPHFEADECGGMGRFVAEAPEAVLVCSDTGAQVNLAGWDYSGPVQGAREGDVIDLGSHRLRFLETPHVHHWDSMMIVEEATRSLFPADLFIQPGEQPPVVRENMGREMCAFYREVGIFPARKPVLDVADRLDALDLAWVHPMHGGSLPAEVAQGYAAALRTEPFTYEGKIFGRPLPAYQPEPEMLVD